jgi:hypothetical protein
MHPRTPCTRSACIRGQSAATIRCNVGIGMSGPCSVGRRSVRSLPQRLQDTSSTGAVRDLAKGNGAERKRVRQESLGDFQESNFDA